MYKKFLSHTTYRLGITLLISISRYFIRKSTIQKLPYGKNPKSQIQCWKQVPRYQFPFNINSNFDLETKHCHLYVASATNVGLHYNLCAHAVWNYNPKWRATLSFGALWVEMVTIRTIPNYTHRTAKVRFPILNNFLRWRVLCNLIDELNE